MIQKPNGAASSPQNSAALKMAADGGDAAIASIRERLDRRARLDRRVDIACKIFIVVLLVLSTALVVMQ